MSQTENRNMDAQLFGDVQQNEYKIFLVSRIRV